MCQQGAHVGKIFIIVSGEFAAEYQETFELVQEKRVSMLLGPKHQRNKSNQLKTHGHLLTKTCVMGRGMIIGEEDIAMMRPSATGKR